MKQAQDLPLSQWLQVNEQIATARKIDTREGGISNDVVRREYDDLSKLGRDLIVWAALVKVAFQQIGAHVRYTLRVIESPAGKIERATVDVGGQDLQASSIVPLR